MVLNIFGPYPSSSSAREMIDFIKSKFKIRQCKSFKYKDRACLNYHIKKCAAPCMGYISIQEYRKQIDEVVNLLEGRTDNILKQIGIEIKKASENLEFEKAAFLRDKFRAIEQVSQKQKVSNITENDIDVIGIARNTLKVCIEIFFVRNSKMVERKHFFFKDLNDETDSEMISNFLKQYYFDAKIFPNKIMIKENIDDKQVLENILIKLAGRKVEIKTPQKGEKLRLVEMAENNAKITLENKVKDYSNILNELKEVLKLECIPNKIECYDISNISGTKTVAAMCVMLNGEVKKSLSRTFRIKTVNGQDDPKSMNEVIMRRLKHSVDIYKDKSSIGFGSLPDVIFVDGGITQIKAAISAINTINEELVLNGQKTLNIPIYGMVKTDKHTTKDLMNKNREELKISRELLNHITFFQDTVHDTAITYHKKLRDKDVTKSSLDNIIGIGDKKKKDLLKFFGSIEKIKKANIDEISNIKGINEELAKKIKNELDKM